MDTPKSKACRVRAELVTIGTHKSEKRTNNCVTAVFLFETVIRIVIKPNDKVPRTTFKIDKLSFPVQLIYISENHI